MNEDRVPRLDELRRLQGLVGRWQGANFDGSDPTHPLLGLVEEVGELSHHWLKSLQRIRSNEYHEEGIKDSIGDIVIYLCAFCVRAGYDLKGCVEDTWEEVRKRNWRTFPEDGRTR